MFPGFSLLTKPKVLVQSLQIEPYSSHFCLGGQHRYPAHLLGAISNIIDLIFESFVEVLIEGVEESLPSLLGLPFHDIRKEEEYVNIEIDHFGLHFCSREELFSWITFSDVFTDRPRSLRKTFCNLLMVDTGLYFCEFKNDGQSAKS